LSSSQFFDDHEVLQIQVIDEDLDQNIRTFQFKILMFQTVNNDQQFFVINLVVAFYENHVLAIKDH